jgi:hypothetical protein
LIDAPEGFVFHHLNAYEEGDQLVVESIFYADFPSIGPDMDFRSIDFELIPEGLLERCRIDLTTGSLSCERLSERCCEFAMVNPTREGLPARYGWMAVAERDQGNDPLQAIKKLDLMNGERRVWSAGPRGFVSEPIMVPRPGATSEDEGWVLTVIWNGARNGSDLVILNASTMAEQAVIAQGDPQASGDPVENQQGDKGLPTPKPWQQGHKSQAMDRRHVEDDSPAGPRSLFWATMKGRCPLRIQTDRGGSPGMARLGPGGSGGTGGDHKKRRKRNSS